MPPFAPGIEAFVARMNALVAAAPAAASVADRRAAYLARCRSFDPPRPPGLTVTDLELPLAPPVRARLYRTRPGLLPALVFFHGGGWVVGDLDSHDAIAAALAVRAGIAVLAVDYRLAPEHRFPAAFADAWAVTAHVAAQGEALELDGARVAVAGDSAGGNLAAAVALAARDRGGPRLCGHALAYPALDAALSLPAATENAEAPLLGRADMVAYWSAYLGPGGDGRDPYASPLQAADLRGLCPGFVAVAERDPLRDDGRAWAERLRADGVPVELRPGAGLVHGYLRAQAVSTAAEAELGAMAAWLRSALDAGV